MTGKLSNIRIKQLPEIDLDLDLFGQVGVALTQLPDINVGVRELPDLNLNLKVSELPQLDIRSNSDVRTDSQLQTRNLLDSTSKVDLKLELQIPRLPRIDLQLGFRPMRFHFPMNYRFGLTLFGFRILDFEACGESMVISEDYVTADQNPSGQEDAP